MAIHDIQKEKKKKKRPYMIKLNCSDFLDTGIYLLFKVMPSKNNLDTFRYLNIKKDTTNHRFLFLKNNAVV